MCVFVTVGGQGGLGTPLTIDLPGTLNVVVKVATGYEGVQEYEDYDKMVAR